MKTRSSIIEQLTPALIQFPRAEAYLFGSYARDQATENSDVDLAIIWDAPALPGMDPISRIQQTARIRKTLRNYLPHTPLDVLWYSPREWTELEQTQQWFAQEIKNGIRVA